MTARTPISLPELYETDFVLWTEKTAELLRQKNFGAVDWENVIEEIESLGRMERHEVENLLTRLTRQLLHLAYGESTGEENPRHRLEEIVHFRIELKRWLKTPSLADHARDCFEEAYSDAREILISAGYVKKTTIPLEPIFSLEQVLDGDWFPVDIDRFLDTGD